jgi:cell division protein FtsQ
MRDYKHVKVPRSYRNPSNRVVVRRVDAGPAAGRSRQRTASLKSLMLQGLAGVIIAGTAWLGWQVYQTVTHAQMFQVAGVDVKGVKQVGEAELKEIAGVFTGKNIFRVDLEAAVKRARTNTWVQDVRIYRRLPNRISMVVVERIPSAVLDNGTGRFLIDSDSTVICRVTPEQASLWQLPTVTMKDAPATPGMPVTGDGLAEALVLLGEIASRGGWQAHEVTVKAGSSESLSVQYAGHEFKIGTGNYSEKLRRLAEVMADVKERGLQIASVDLRPDRQVAVMVKKDGVTKKEVVKGQGAPARKKRKS